MSEVETSAGDEACPYAGLKYFEDDAGAWFFGRDTERDSLITNLRAARLTLLYAESGVGKSSLLRAGVAWHLRRPVRTQAVTSSSAIDIPIVFSLWKDDPTTDLITAIGDGIKPFLEAIEPGLAARTKPPERTSLADAIDAAAKTVSEAVHRKRGDGPTSGPSVNLLLILDQFEDYLYRADETPPERLADEIGRCINRADLPASFLISIREDAYARFGNVFKRRIDDPFGNFLHLDHLTRDHAMQAVCEPLRVYGEREGVSVELEGGLAQRVLEEVPLRREEADSASTNPGSNGDVQVSSPLLQLVMERLWLERDKERSPQLLRVATLERGGVRSIVDEHVYKAIDAMDEDDRQIAIDVFDHLVADDPGKIALTVRDLAEKTSRRNPEEQVEAVLRQLDNARILKPVEPRRGLDPRRYRRYEIFHDVLGPVLKRVVQRATEEELDRESKEQQRRAETEARHAREQRELAARLRRRLLLTVLAAVACLALGALALVFLESAREARNKEREVAKLSLSNALAAESENLLSTNVALASLLSLKSRELAQTDESRAAVENAMQMPLDAILSDPSARSKDIAGLAFAPRGGVLASGDKAGHIVLWRAARSGPPGGSYARLGELSVPDGRKVDSLAFSASGLVASGDEGGDITLWDVKDPAHPRLAPGGRVHVEGHPSYVFSVAFNPRGDRLASGDNEFSMRVWTVPPNGDIAARAPRSLRVGSNVMTVAFNRSGQTVAGGLGNGQVVLWNPTTGRERRLRGRQTVFSVAFSPSGEILASGNDEGDVVLWNAADGSRIGVMNDSAPSAVHSVAFSATGRTLASGDYTGKVTLWRVATHSPLGSPLPDGSTVESVAFSPTGETVASGDFSGQVVAWDVASHARAAAPLVHGSEVSSVAFSPMGDILASGDAAGAIAFQGIAANAAVPAPLHDAGPVLSLAFDPTGHLLASAGRNGTVTLWDLRTAHGQTVRPCHVGPCHVRAVAFGRGGKLLASGDDSGYVTVWRVEAGRLAGHAQAVSDEEQPVLSIAFNRAGTRLISGEEVGNAAIWRVDRSGGLQREATALPDGSDLRSLVFSPVDDRTIATGDDTGRVVLWDVAKGESRPLVADGGQVFSVGFSADGKVLAAAGQSGNVLLWDATLASPRPIGRIRGDGSVIDSIAFSPDGSKLASGGRDGEVELYSTGFGSGTVADLKARLCGEVRSNLSEREWNRYLPRIHPVKLCPGY
jgi:WD40 repeat protein